MIRKKSLVLLPLVAISSSVLAANYPIFVTVPDLRTGTEFSFTALALKPAASNLNYVILNKELPTQSPTWTEREIMPGYSFAFALGARYVFCEGKDLSLNWTHMNSLSTTYVSTNGDPSYFLGPDYEIGPNSIPITSAQGRAQFKYDVINLDGGQYVSFGRHMDMRFFGGLSNGYLREEVTSVFMGNISVGEAIGPFRTKQIVTSNFTGLGPRIGMSGQFNTDYGIGLVGEAAASLLIGSSHAKTGYVSSSPLLQAAFQQSKNIQFIRDQWNTQVVPGFDAKLGANYKHLFRKCYLLTVEGGYEAAVYLNAINQYLPGSLVDGTALSDGGIYVATMNHTLSNYSVHGPYLKTAISFG